MLSSKLVNLLSWGAQPQLNLVHLNQPVRWRTKPRWLPIAKSKKFRIIPRLVIPEEKREELRYLSNTYATITRATRTFLLNYKTKKPKDEFADSVAVEEEEWKECLRINEEWNRNIAKEREIYVENKISNTIKEIKQLKEDKMAKQRYLLEVAETKIQQEIEAAKTFITRETLDAAIEKCMENYTEYNFAIDLKGNRYVDDNVRNKDFFNELD